MEIEILAQKIVDELVSSGALARAVAKATATSDEPPASNDHYTDDQKLRFGLRGDVMSLVGKVCEKHNLESKLVFGELKKRTGVSQPEATAIQLQERIDLLQAWLENGIK